MNKKGSALLIILFAIIYFMAGMIIFQLIKPDITLARTSLTCTNPDDDADMFNCLIIDSVVPIFIVLVLSVTAGYITGGGK